MRTSETEMYKLRQLKERQKSCGIIGKPKTKKVQSDSKRKRR